MGILSVLSASFIVFHLVETIVACSAVSHILLIFFEGHYISHLFQFLLEVTHVKSFAVDAFEESSQLQSGKFVRKELEKNPPRWKQDRKKQMTWCSQSVHFVVNYFGI